MATHHLFPLLPAELRNEIYSYLDNCALVSTHSISLPLKNYTFGHTTVQLCAVHHGSTSLLDLSKYGFLEGDEYKSWLLGKGLEIWINVHFTGHLNTFIQKDWDAKMKASLNKLAKRYPWLVNVAKYRVRIDWEPKVDSLARAPRGISGTIADDMVRILTSLQDPRVREKANLSATMSIAPSVQVQTYVKNLHLGLHNFLSGSVSTYADRGTRTVTAPPIGGLEPGSSVLPIVVKGDKSVCWAENGEGLVVRKGIEGVGLGRRVDEERNRIWMYLLDECGELKG
jgi:hypothetical protein